MAIAERLAFKPGAHAPQGVTVEGILAEREIIVQERGAATSAISADAALEEPDRFPNLRPWGPDTPEEAMRLCMEDGIRHAYASIVLLRTEGSKEKEREVHVRFLYAVPKEGYDDLSYEPIILVRQERASRRFVIAKLRQEAQNYAERLTNTLAELEEMED